MPLIPYKNNMPALNAKQQAELGDAFLALAQSVGNYRMQHRATLTRAQNRQLQDLHLSLLEYSDGLYTASAKVVIKEVEKSLDAIKGIAAQLLQTYHRLDSVQKAIDVAAAAVNLGGSLLAKDPQALLKAIITLADKWDKGNR